MTQSKRSLYEFLAADVHERFSWFRKDIVSHAELLHYLGVDGFAQYEDLVRGTPPHLGGPPTNLIFVPGAMGSLLHSRNLGGVWWIDIQNLRHIKDLRLSDDGVNDFVTDHEVVPFGVHLNYERFRAAILRDDRFNHRAYPYDWRKSLRSSALGLKEMIEQMYADNGERKIHLVAHSMGGLVIRALLADADLSLWSKLGRIAFIATPHYGSPSIAGYLKNHLWGWESLAALALYLPREAFRSMRGILNLLPAPDDIYPEPGLAPVKYREGEYRHPCANFNLYEAGEWKLDVSDGEGERLQEVLDEAAAMHRLLDATHKKLTIAQREAMLTVSGVGYRTLFRLEFAKGFLWSSMDKEYARKRGNPHRDGDGRVPVVSARLDGVRAGYVRGKHDDLPNIPDVYTSVLNWLLEDGDWLLADSVEGAYDTSHLGGTQGSGGSDDPGWWHEVDAAAVEALAGRIERGEVPEFTGVHIL